MGLLLKLRTIISILITNILSSSFFLLKRWGEDARLEGT